jgi:hydrogenase maturation factor HypF (carbamoyltransferase family)
MSRLIIGLRHRVSFEGQAAMELEYVVDPSIQESYLFELEDGLSWRTVRHLSSTGNRRSRGF